MQNDNNHKNLAAAILENGGYSSDTSLTIPTTSATTFPDVPFFATIMPTTDLANSNNSEIVEVTATSTSGSDTTFTISRGQRGTTAINWDAGKAVLVHAIYTEDVVYIDTTLSTPTNIAYVSEDNIQTGAVTTSKIANSAVTSDKIDWTTITYPTNESTRIGTWFDGSALYRRTIHKEITSTETELSFTMGDSASTGIVWVEGSFFRTNNARFPINFLHTVNTNLKCMCFPGGANQINYWAPPGAISLDLNVYYTKTS